MNIQTRNNNRRLLDALDHVDIRYVDELVSGLRLPKEKHADPVLTWRTPLKHWKAIAALAACVVLFAFASPTVSFISQVVSSFSSAAGGNAGAGSENIENTDYFNYSSDMSVDEVLADVIEKGYVVISDGKCISGKEKWDDFLKSVENGEPSTVRIAYHESYEWVASSPIVSHTILNDLPTICLRAVEYNGETFKFVSKKHKLETVFEKEYPYIVSYDSGATTTYYVSLLTKEELSVPDSPNPFAKACGHGSSISSNMADQCDCLKVIIFFD